MTNPLDELVQATPAKKKSKKLSAREVGCAFCPLNKVPGIKKVKGTVEGKEIFIWGMAPGPEENKEGREFVGRSGRLLWDELKIVGITRDMCDIQNVVRCFPADYNDTEWPPLTMRDPTPEEIHCCSIFTKQAIEFHQAKVHLIFGAVAAKALLGVEYKKGKKSFWSDKLNAHVMCLYHPSFFIRQGYGGKVPQAPNSFYKQWRADFKHAASLLLSKGQFSYIE
jgi:uracil-DNA glycosylase family 4